MNPDILTHAEPAERAAEGTAAPQWQTSVVHEDDDLLIELRVRTPAQDSVAVTFDPIMVDTAQPAYAGDFLRRCGVDTLAVRKKREHFYQPLSRERFLQLCEPHLKRYRRRLAYGSSLGAYAVLYYCQHGFETVIASSPRVSAHPLYGTEFWQLRVPFEHQAFDPEHPASSAAVVFYDPHDEQDLHFVEGEIRPAWPHAHWWAVPYAGHPANQFLSEIGFIAPFVRAVVAGKPAPALDRRLKARSATYHQVLAMACLRHGKPRWALQLATHALQLNARLVLAHRTLGEARLALGMLDEAEAALRQFTATYPLDGQALQALRQLADRRGDATPPAQPLQPGAAGDALRAPGGDGALGALGSLARRTAAAWRRRF